MTRQEQVVFSWLRVCVFVGAFLAICLYGLFTATHANAQREYVQSIYLSGFKCITIRRDGLAGGTSEVFFTFVTNAPESSGVQSGSVGTFNGVRAGHGRRTRNLVWSGRQQPLSLRVSMFERDIGGQSGQTAARAMAEMVTAYLGRSGSTPTRSGSSLNRDNAAEPGILRNLGRGITDVLGLGHDPLGYDRQIFGRGDWSSRPTYSERDIRYHFHTTHRQNGANCRAYFLIERGAEIPQAPPPREPEPPPPRQEFPPPPDVQGGYDDGSYDGIEPPLDEYPPPLPPLPPPPPPPPPEPDWFRVAFRNSCDVPISISYTYENPSRGWVKRGWGNYDPGETRNMEGNTLTPEIYLYSSRGRVSGSFDPEEMELAVRREGFDVDRAESFRGEAGERHVPFKLHVLSDIAGTELIVFRDCEEWIAGRLLSPEELARNRRVRELNIRQAQISLNSSLDDAAFAGDVEGIRTALTRGADIENRSYRLSAGRSTPLHLAVRSFNAAAINLLLDEGADATTVNYQGGTVLHAAVGRYSTRRYFEDFPIEVFERLIEAGADPNHLNNDGRTALDVLVRFLHPLNLRDRMARSEDKGRSGDDLLAFLADHTTVGLDRQHEGQSPYRNYTALHMAAISGHRAFAQALVANGADLTIKDASGRTARELAAAWPLEFQEVFGPLPMPAPQVAEIQEPDEGPTEPEVLAPRPPFDPEVYAARCAQLVAQGVIAPDECEVPN